MAIDLPPPDRDHRTIGSWKRTICAYILSPDRIQAASERRAAQPPGRRVMMFGVTTLILGAIIGRMQIYDFTLTLLGR